ncbi:hypothetical protein SAY87_019924 [Trapa incisa]|uniref:Uncharacterized protein n=1 Tax=Trapa incisa TaxID=236973 RepID=A0AAN7JZZ6_9MYRT|nr:hypothetical protein SAY87_019924 [Trapa incisa]
MELPRHIRDVHSLPTQLDSACRSRPEIIHIQSFPDRLCFKASASYHDDPGVLNRYQELKYPKINKGEYYHYRAGGPNPSSQMISLVMGTLYGRFIEKDIQNFQDFHIAVLDIFNTFNSALPGKHFDVPPRSDIEACYTQWKDAPGLKKRKVFVNFIAEYVNLNKLDDYTVLTGIVIPPAAMAVKKVGENVPQLKIIKAIPDVVFVPSATVLALISAKLSRRIFLKNLNP